MNKYHFIAIVGAILLVFLNIFRNHFVIDDFTFIINWPLNQNLSHLAELIRGQLPEGHQNAYRPIATIISALYHQLWGTNIFFYHLAAITLHVLNSILVYLLTRRLTKSSLAALIAGVMFGVHPVHVEMVTYITASIGGLWSALFFFLSFYLYLVPARPRLARLGSLIFALLAFFTYEMTLILPIILIIYDVFFNRGGRNKLLSRIKLCLPFFLGLFFYFLLKLILLNTIFRGTQTVSSIYANFLAGILSLLKYTELLAFPVNQAYNHILYPGIETILYRDYRIGNLLNLSLFDGRVLLGLTLISSLVIFIVKGYKRHPLIAYGTIFYVISLVPVTPMIPQWSLMHERFLYIGSFGFVLIVGVLVKSAKFKVQNYNSKFKIDARRHPEQSEGSHGILRPSSDGLRMTNKLSTFNFALLTYVPVLILVIFYGYLTINRNSDWRDEVGLWSKDIKSYPEDNVYAYFQLGNAYEQINQNDLALKAYQKSFDINPHFVVALASKGVVYANMGKPDLAIETYKKAVLISPYFWEGHNNLGNIYLKTGKTDLAEGELRQTIAMNPNFLPARLNLESLLSDKIGTASAKNNWIKYSFNPSADGFSFKYPATWTLETPSKDTLTITSDTKSFKIEFFQDTRREDLSAQDYVERDTANFGKLVNQGLAKIPNVDFGFVKVWDFEGRPKLQFFLFKGKKVIQVIVFPGDSPFMKQFDAILASISL